MQCKFLHLADIHLGYKQYNCDSRADDFGRAFEQALEIAISNQVDFVLIAGDLFHKQSIDPHTLYQANELLSMLRQRDILVLAVAGNHDRARQEDGMGWLEYLNATRQLVLLDATIGEGECGLTWWNDDTRKGTIIDLPCGTRVVGMRYYGASTPRILETYRQTLASLDKAPFTILMTHAGLQGTMDFEAAMVSRSQLEPFRNLVDYVALGHFHKPFSQDDWIYNPGSLETVTVEECAWPDRGAYLVQVDSERSPEHQAEKVITKRRPFVRLVIQVDTLLNPAEMSHAVTQAARDYMPGEGGQRPVIDIFLRGALQYDRALLDTKALEETVHLSCNPLVARIVDQTALDSSDIALAETLSRPEVEQQVLSELIKRDARVRGAEKKWSTLITHLKNAALLGTAPNEIARELRMFLANHPLENGNADQVGIVS